MRFGHNQKLGSDFNPYHLVWLLFPSAIAWLSRSLRPIDPFDYWWYLALGRRIDKTGEIPDSNLFLFTLPAETEFINVPWLAELLMYNLWELGGHSLLKIVENGHAFIVALVLTACTALLTRHIALSSLCSLFTLSAIPPVLEMRSRTFVLVPFILFIYLLLKAIQESDGRLFWIAVPLTAFWVHVHGSFLIVPGMVLLSIAGHLLEPQQGTDNQFIWHGTGSIVLSLSTVFTHPAGAWEIISKYLYPLVVDVQTTTRIGEWQPIWQTTISTQFLVYSSIAVAAFVIATAERVRCTDLLVLSATAVLQLSSLRMMFWWFISFTMICAPMLADRLTHDVRDILNHRGYILPVAAITTAGLLLSLNIQPGMPFQTSTLKALGKQNFAVSGPGKGALRRDTPIRLAERATSYRIPRIFHHQSVSGLLQFYRKLTSFKQNRIIFINQRFSMITRKLTHNQLHISRSQPGWKQLVDAWKIDTMLLSRRHQSALLQSLLETREWRRLAAYHQYVLLRKHEGSQLYPPVGASWD